MATYRNTKGFGLGPTRTPGKGKSKGTSPISARVGKPCPSDGSMQHLSKKTVKETLRGKA